MIALNRASPRRKPRASIRGETMRRLALGLRRGLVGHLARGRT